MLQEISFDILYAIMEALKSGDYKDGLLHVADILHIELPAAVYAENYKPAEAA